MIRGVIILMVLVTGCIHWPGIDNRNRQPVQQLPPVPAGMVIQTNAPATQKRTAVGRVAQDIPLTGMIGFRYVLPNVLVFQMPVGYNPAEFDWQIEATTNFQDWYSAVGTNIGGGFAVTNNKPMEFFRVHGTHI